MDVPRKVAGFDRLLHPVDEEEFFAEILERRPLLIRRDDPGFYASILTLDEIDALLRNPGTPSHALRVHKSGTEVPPHRWSRGAEIEVDAIGTLFAEGATLIINSANRFFRPMADFCNCVEKQLGYRVQPNIYITPAGSQGFRQHYDDHDVFIMQVYGRKSWRLYGAPVELPSQFQSHKWGEHTHSQPEATFELNEGDVLYIPRGHLHDAESRDLASVHITLGLHPTYFYQVVEEIARKARDRPGFRRAVPNLLANEPKEVVIARMKQMIHDLIGEIDIADILEEFDSRHVSHRMPGRRVPFTDLLALPALAEDTCIMPVEDLVYRLERTADSVRLRLAGPQLLFPLFMEEPLRAILERPSIEIGRIPGLLDGEGRIKLARQLIAAGAVRTVGIPETQYLIQ